MFLKGLFDRLVPENKTIEKRRTQEVRGYPDLSPAVVVDSSEYDATDIVSTFRYAMLKYGDSICRDSIRLKNIMSDLASSHRNEIKLLALLCNNGNLEKAIGSVNWHEADLYIWIDNATEYLVKEEFIDKRIAYDFTRRLLSGISEKNIQDKYTDSIEKKENNEADELRKKQAAHDRAVKAAETRRRNAEAKKLEEIKRKLAEEEQARIYAEAKAVSERIEREREKKEAAERLEQEKRKRNSGSIFRTTSVRSETAVNYSERMTAQKLFNKYNGKIDGNVIVVAEDWTGDFCFVIDEIVRKNGLKAKGTLYKDGNFYKNYSYPADDYLFHIYNGPSKSRINRIHVKRDSDGSATLVSKSTTSPKTATKKSNSSTSNRFKEGKTLKEFFEKNGFEVIDKRYNNGCLWVIGDRKRLDPYIEMARIKFGPTCIGEFASGRATDGRKGWWTKCTR